MHHQLLPKFKFPTFARTGLLIAAALCVGFSQGFSQSSKIMQDLQVQMELSQGPVAAYAVLFEQADGRLLRQEALSRGVNNVDASSAVIERLEKENKAYQKPFVSRLQQLDEVSDIKPLWLANIVGFTASDEALEQIANMPEVSGVFYDAPWEVEEVQDLGPSSILPGSREPGHSAIKADRMWARGYTGFGGIAFTADTGVDPFHPALNHKYAAFDGRAEAWYGYEADDVFPFDCDDHGTHVNGTILGLDRVTSDTIGVAPNAHWVGGAILCGLGTVDNIGAFQWSLDPDGDPSTTADRPTVINNSWRDPSISNVECGASNPYPIVLDNMLAAGISVIFSAGNSGPEPTTITPPHNYNAGLVNVFAIGALNGNTPNYTIADFSSRGPALCLRDSTELDIKPEVSAPGVSVRSCEPGNIYGFKSGTSMAAPHVAGAILLLHEAFPDLTGEELQLALYYSAIDLGDAGEDNTYGRGIIDVDAAYNYLMGEGNTPVAPQFPDLAPVMIAIDAPDQQCGSSLEVQVTIRNEGIIAIDEISYSVISSGASNETISDSQVVDIAPGATSDVTITMPITSSGERIVSVVLESANGDALDRRLDLGGTIRVAVSPSQPPTITRTTDDVALCANSPLILGLDSDIDAPIIAHWAQNPNLLPLFSLGESPSIINGITSPTTLYGIAEFQESGLFPTPQNLSYLDADDMVMIYTANRSGRIRSVEVDLEESQRVTISIRDEDDARVTRFSKTLDAGKQRIELNAAFNANEDYTIEIERAERMAQSTSSPIDGVAIGSSLVGGRVFNGATGQQANTSFFFFNWDIGFYDGCAPVAIDILPDTSRVAREVTVEPSQQMITLGETVDLMDVSSNRVTSRSWWVNGEKLTDTTSSFGFTPAMTGDHMVWMAGMDDQGCMTADSTLFTVNPDLSSASDLVESLLIRVSPNPTAGRLVFSGTDAEIIEEIEVIGVTGQRVLVTALSGNELDVSRLPAGTYQMIVTVAGGLRQNISFVKK